MATVTFNIPDKYEALTSPSIMNKITTYFIEDYLVELYQDEITKTELVNNEYDIELNNKLKARLGI